MEAKGNSSWIRNKALHFRLVPSFVFSSDFTETILNKLSWLKLNRRTLGNFKNTSYCCWLIEFAKDRSFFYGSDMVGRFLGHSPTCVRRHATMGQTLILERFFASSYPFLFPTFYLQVSIRMDCNGAMLCSNRSFCEKTCGAAALRCGEALADFLQMVSLSLLMECHHFWVSADYRSPSGDL